MARVTVALAGVLLLGSLVVAAQETPASSVASVLAETRRLIPSSSC